MLHSESIKELAAALAKAQGMIKPALKDQANPFFKSKYADLASVWEACREALSTNGLAVIQGSVTPYDANGEPIGHMVQVETMIVHSSGEWISSVISMTPSKFDPQSILATVTYARRGSLAAMCGVAPEDDDGNQSSGRSVPVATTTPGEPSIPYPEVEAELIELMKNPVWTEAQRDACNEFITGCPNYPALVAKVKQAKWYVENKPKMDARDHVKEEKLKKGKKPAASAQETIKLDQRELTEEENAALDREIRN